MTNDLVSTYVNYVSKRAAIRARQRTELDNELYPFLKELGDAIIEAQASGKRIEDIEYIIGAKNRTLVYNAKRASKGQKLQPAPEPQPEPDKPAEKRWKVWDAGNGGFDAYIDGAFVGTVWKDRDESIEVPDEWAADTKNQSLYREIVSHVKNL